jgi:hypothetical protein
MISKKDEPKDISVIIVNYKSQRYLERCLGSLYLLAGKEVSLDVIIVNNDPQENLEKIGNLFPGIKMIVNSKNVGFGRGNNIGARQASGEYLFFLNPDTEILDGSMAKVLEEFKKDADLGAVGGCLMTEGHKIQEWSAGMEVTLRDIIKNNLGILSSRRVWESEKKLEADWVAGTAFFISRKLFLNSGGFDENIFMFFEDVDLCKRIKAAGKKIFYFPGLKVLHKCGGSYESESKKTQKQNYYDSMVYYFKKHRPKAEALAVRAIRKILFS